MPAFIKRNYKYTLRHLKTGAARIFIQNKRALQSAGFFKETYNEAKSGLGDGERIFDSDGQLKGLGLTL